jgi:hypothetical protein
MPHRIDITAARPPAPAIDVPFEPLRLVQERLVPGAIVPAESLRGSSVTPVTWPTVFGVGVAAAPAAGFAGDAGWAGAELADAPDNDVTGAPYREVGEAAAAVVLATTRAPGGAGRF